MLLCTSMVLRITQGYISGYDNVDTNLCHKIEQK